MLLVEVSSLLLLCLSATADQQETTVKPGDDATLQCHFPSDAAVTLLEWTRLEQKSVRHLLFYRNNRLYKRYQHPSFSGRVELRDPEMKGGDVSVTLKNVTVNDAGMYNCQIIRSTTENGERTTSEFSNFVSLTVTDSGPSVPMGEGNKEEGNKEEGDKDEGDNGGGNEDEGNTGVVLVACLTVAGLLLIIGAVVFFSYKLINKHLCPNREKREGRWTSWDTNKPHEPMC